MNFVRKKLRFIFLLSALTASATHASEGVDNDNSAVTAPVSCAEISRDALNRLGERLSQEDKHDLIISPEETKSKLLRKDRDQIQLIRYFIAREDNPDNLDCLLNLQEASEQKYDFLKSKRQLGHILQTQTRRCEQLDPSAKTGRALLLLEDEKYLPNETFVEASIPIMEPIGKAKEFLNILSAAAFKYKGKDAKIREALAFMLIDDVTKIAIQLRRYELVMKKEEKDIHSNVKACKSHLCSYFAVILPPYLKVVRPLKLQGHLSYQQFRVLVNYHLAMATLTQDKSQLEQAQRMCDHNENFVGYRDGRRVHIEIGNVQTLVELKL